MSTLQKLNLKAEHGTMQEEIPLFGKSIHFHPLGRFQDNIHIFGEYLNLSSNFHKSFYYFVHLFFLWGKRFKYPSPMVLHLNPRHWDKSSVSARSSKWKAFAWRKKRSDGAGLEPRGKKIITAGDFPAKTWLITSWWLNQTQPGVFFHKSPGCLAEMTLNPLVFALGGRGEKGVGSQTLAGILVGRKGMVSKWRHHSKTQRFPTQHILK